MTTIKIYGCSDDLIEIDGDIREEFQATDDDQAVAIFDGTLIGLIYDLDGCWRLNVMAKGKNSIIEKEEVDISDEYSYSDIITITAESIEWIVLCDQIVRPKK